MKTRMNENLRTPLPGAAGDGSAYDQDAPLVVHLLYRLDFGGLETVLAECVNRMPAGTYRHAIVCLSDYTAFSEKITRPGVQIIALHKAPGLGLGTHVKLFKLLRTLRPAILHTYNVSAVEYALTATLAGVPVRIHAEHGRDLSDINGTNRKHALLRRLMVPFVDCFVPVSHDLRRWLTEVIGVPDTKNRLINNGVDTARFSPATRFDRSAADAGAQTAAGADGSTTTVAGVQAQNDTDARPVFSIGTVGRVQDIKNHKGLVETFLRLRELLPDQRGRMTLTIVGDGPLMQALQTQVAASGAADAIRLTGARSDVAELMRGFSVFTLPSFNEGTPITLLEAMSCGLPVVASRVGGIPEVVREQVSGMLLAPTDHDGMARALAAYASDPALARRHGAAARQTVEQTYSIDAMLAAYMALYDTLCNRKLRTTSSRKPVTSCVE